jgi:hypothetical protein
MSRHVSARLRNKRAETSRDSTSKKDLAYKSLFADYLQGASKITIEDPYIRLPYQIKNLLEFFGVIIEQKAIDQEIDIHLITWDTEERTPDSVDAFDEIQESMAEMGINFMFIPLTFRTKFCKSPKTVPQIRRIVYLSLEHHFPKQRIGREIYHRCFHPTTILHPFPAWS